MKASDGAMRAALVGQFVDTAATLEGLVRQDMQPQSNGGIDITQRELESLYRDAYKTALYELEHKSFAAGSRLAPLLDGMDKPKFAREVADTTLAGVLQRMQPNIRMPVKPSNAETPITRDAKELRESLDHGYDVLIDGSGGNNADAIADIVAATPGYVARANTPEGADQARYALIAVKRLIAQLATFADNPILAERRTKMEGVRDALQAALDTSNDPTM